MGLTIKFAKDVANAYARLCDRQEHKNDGRLG